MGKTAILRIHPNNMIRAVPDVNGSQRRQAAGSSFAPVQEADLCGFQLSLAPGFLLDVGGVGSRWAVGGRGGFRVYFPASHPLSAVCLLNVHLLPGVSSSVVRVLTRI